MPRLVVELKLEKQINRRIMGTMAIDFAEQLEFLPKPEDSFARRVGRAVVSTINNVRGERGSFRRLVFSGAAAGAGFFGVGAAITVPVVESVTNNSSAQIGATLDNSRIAKGISYLKNQRRLQAGIETVPQVEATLHQVATSLNRLNAKIAEIEKADPSLAGLLDTLPSGPLSGSQTAEAASTGK